ncbi:hypothetical protein GGS20DRAFT_68792 [Poronia punctata]|nr:hypothetical protein GGS20DRAFT_68792 [Poronia punctata]
MGLGLGAILASAFSAWNGVMVHFIVFACSCSFELSVCKAMFGYVLTDTPTTCVWHILVVMPDQNLHYGYISRRNNHSVAGCQSSAFLWPLFISTKPDDQIEQRILQGCSTSVLHLFGVNLLIQYQSLQTLQFHSVIFRELSWLSVK